MASNPKRFLKLFLGIVVVGYLVLGSISLIGHWFLVSNISPSVPIGLYLKTYNSDAPFVRVCLHGDVLKEAERHGLQTTGGDCPDGTSPLLKPVFRSDAPVILTPDGFVENGQILHNTKPKSVALDGTPISHYPYGVYKQSPDSLWLVSTFNASSFDSRYFGAVPKDQILSYARPLLVAPRGTFGTD